jgi:hypothetical protein
MKQLFALILLLIIIPNHSFAQFPQGINYQSVIRDNNGNIIQNHLVGIKINIHEGTAGGSSIYSETFTPTTNQFGLVNMVIGQGNVQLGTFDSISWGTNTFYAEIMLDTSGGTTYISMGTQQMVSVPYALFANKANESQTLSINGNNLSISSGNSVTLPGNGGGSNAGICTQTVSLTSNQFIGATSEPNVDSFISLSSINGFNIIKSDIVTNVMQETGTVNATPYNNCGNPVSTSITTYHSQVYFLYSNLCGPTIGAAGLYPNNITIIGATLPTSGSNGLIFTDGTYVYVHNNTSNWTKFSVSTSGDTFTNAGTLILQNSSALTKAVCFDGTYFYCITGSTLYKMDNSGNPISSKPVYEAATGLVNIDATKIYILSGTQVIGASGNSNYAVIMTPIGKP